MRAAIVIVWEGRLDSLCTYLKIQKKGGFFMGFLNDYDRFERNESDGQGFYGYDDEKTGTTEWYTEDGVLDSVTKTPSDDE